MPAVMQQVDSLSLSDKMRMMKFLVQSIEKVVAREEDCEDRQRNALLSLAGGWKDRRTEGEIIADIESHRSLGREVAM